MTLTDPHNRTATRQAQCLAGLHGLVLIVIRVILGFSRKVFFDQKVHHRIIFHSDQEPKTS